MVCLSFVYVAVLIAGILLGFTGISFPVYIQEVLALLLFIIGIDLMMSEDKAEKIKNSWKSSMRLVVATVIGSIAGGMIAGALTGMNLKTAMAIGAGMGWYSLTGPYLAAKAGTFAGAVGFTSNFFRELLTIVFYPKMPDKEAGISAGGATTMDSTLPIIASFGKDLSLTAFMHGFVISALVPLLLFILG